MDHLGVFLAVDLLVSDLKQDAIISPAGGMTPRRKPLIQLNAEILSKLFLLNGFIDDLIYLINVELAETSEPEFSLSGAALLFELILLA